MAVIADYYNGPCHIIVHDDCIEPPEKVEKILEFVSKKDREAAFREYQKAKKQMQEQE